MVGHIAHAHYLYCMSTACRFYTLVVFCCLLLPSAVWAQSAQYNITYRADELTRTLKEHLDRAYTVEQRAYDLRTMKGYAQADDVMVEAIDFFKTYRGYSYNFWKQNAAAMDSLRYRRVVLNNQWLVDAELRYPAGDSLKYYQQTSLLNIYNSYAIAGDMEYMERTKELLDRAGYEFEHLSFSLFAHGSIPLEFNSAKLLNGPMIGFGGAIGSLRKENRILGKARDGFDIMLGIDAVPVAGLAGISFGFQRFKDRFIFGAHLTLAGFSNFNDPQTPGSRSTTVNAYIPRAEIGYVKGNLAFLLSAHLPIASTNAPVKTVEYTMDNWPRFNVGVRYTLPFQVKD